MGKVPGDEELTPIPCLAAPAAECRKVDVQAVGGESVRQRLGVLERLRSRYAEMRARHFLEIGAAAVTIVAFAISSDLRQLLLAEVHLPVWILLGVVATVSGASWMLAHRKQRPDQPSGLPYNSILNIRPKAVLVGNPAAVDRIPAAVLKHHEGSFSTWLYLHHLGDGIRTDKNNRYVLACASNRTKPYKDVVAFFRGLGGPGETDPTWRLWLANSEGKGRSWGYLDSKELSPGWHLFVVRWDRAVPRLELLIDGKAVIDANGFESFWPKSSPDRFYIGCFPTLLNIFFVNTWLWRTQLLPLYVDDAWIEAELKNTRPAVPV